MVKRMCVLYPDGSINVVEGNQRSDAAQINEARKLCDGFNKGETDKAKLATFGQIEVDLMSFKELR